MAPSPGVEIRAGAVPRTAYAVSVTWPVPKNPGDVTCHALNVCIRLSTLATVLSWNTPARLVFGPCSGVPAIVGVDESRTTRPGAPGSGPGWNVGAFGSLKNGM